jgi:hypothetical protein
MLALANGRIWRDHRGGGPLATKDEPRPMPVYANEGLGEGPLGEEDRENFHP